MEIFSCCHYLKILESKNIEFVLKLHPRANNKYAENFKHLSNLNISNQAITEILSKVDMVYTAYIASSYRGILFGNRC